MAASWPLDKFCNKLTTPCSGTFCGLILLSDLLILRGFMYDDKIFPTDLHHVPFALSVFSHLEFLC